MCEKATMWQRYLLSYLRTQLNEAKSKNPSFSLRSFALKLGLSPGMLSEILNEHRTITPRTAKKIIDRVSISSEERNRFLQMMEEPPGPSKGTHLRHFRWLSRRPKVRQRRDTAFS